MLQKVITPAAFSQFASSSLWDKAGKMLNTVLLPFIGISLFIVLWASAAKSIDTSLGQFPGPLQVWEQASVLVDEHLEKQEKADAFYERQQVRAAKRLESDPTYVVKIKSFTGAPSFFDQIRTSLFTVMFGFLVASLIAVPIGIISGLSKSTYAAINPLIQLFKPVSPLAWLPLVTMVVSAVYVSSDPMFSKSFITSAVTVSLCCIWPTLVNTSVGVSNIDSDLVNVSKVLRLNPFKHVIKIVLPSSIPMIFTGLRLSLSIGWMVLIAAEMLAQNPGLGKFVWDEFQNGSSESLARIMVAVLTIGVIGFILDRLMLLLQKSVSWDKTATLR